MARLFGTKGQAVCGVCCDASMPLWLCQPPVPNILVWRESPTFSQLVGSVCAFRINPPAPEAIDYGPHHLWPINYRVPGNSGLCAWLLTAWTHSVTLVLGEAAGLPQNPLKDSIYWPWKYFHRMFISLRLSAPNSLAPCSCVCPKLSGHLTAMGVTLSTFPRLLSGSRIRF